MTVSSTQSKAVGQGNGATTSFPYSFLIPDAASLVVTYTDASGNQTQLAPSQFNVSGLDSQNGGTVTYPLSGSPIASGTSLTIERVTPITQPTTLLNQGGYFPTAVEAAMDRIVMILQELAGGALDNELALKFPAVDVNPTTQLPPANARANKFLGFDLQGNPVALSSSLVAPDLSSYSATATGTVTSRTMAARLADQTNVKDFGAKGDGSTDDTLKIQAGIDFLAALGGGTLVFPRGVYKVSTITLKTNVRLLGERFQPQTTTDAVVLLGSAAGTMIDTPVASTGGVGMQGFFVIGAGSLSNIGLHLRNVSSSIFRDLVFDQFLDNALLEDAGVANLFENLTGFNLVLNRTRGAKTGAFDINGTDHRIFNVEFTCSQSGLSDANQYVCGIAIRGANHFADMLIGHTSDNPIYIAATESRFLQLRAENGFGHGIDVSAGGTNQIIAAYSRGNSVAAANTYDGFYIGASQANVFVGCRAAIGQHKYGFQDTGQFSAIGSRNYYVACRSDNHQTAAWSIAVGSGLGSGPLHQPLMLFATNGDTTPSVEQARFLSLTNYSAPTTLTNLTKGTHGQTVRIIGNTNCTIKNGTNFMTNTGADKALVGSRCYRFTLIDSVWYEDA